MIIFWYFYFLLLSRVHSSDFFSDASPQLAIRVWRSSLDIPVSSIKDIPGSEGLLLDIPVAWENILVSNCRCLEVFVQSSFNHLFCFLSSDLCVIFQYPKRVGGEEYLNYTLHHISTISISMLALVSAIFTLVIWITPWICDC